jgi:cytidine deaminase
MLLYSASDDKELERFRGQTGTCVRLVDQDPLMNVAEVMETLPRLMSMMLKARLRAGGWLGGLMLQADEVEDLVQTLPLSRNDLMLKLLDVASSLAQGPEGERAAGAVAEGLRGGLYVGNPIAWKGEGVKFSVHAAQAALINAWHNSENQVKRLMLETPPCPCCRQFMRETWIWKSLKIMVRPRSSIAKKDTALIQEQALNIDTLREEGIQSRLFGEPKRSIVLPKPDMGDCTIVAADAASYAYAPYSRNYAGVAIKTNRGTVHQGRYAEVVESIAGVSAIEAAIVDMALSGGQFTDITEIALVETKGSVSQFPGTHRLAQAMGGLPFNYVLVG